VLTTRFTVVPAGLARQVQGLDDLQVLDALLRRAIVAQSLAVFREELDQLLAQ
ncbi:MAG: transposase, partial [Candidatus Schekmanbacteria bacterium]|nr:transposase [Candidatus Schekmanbacteria bacterium]